MKSWDAMTREILVAGNGNIGRRVQGDLAKPGVAPRRG